MRSRNIVFPFALSLSKGESASLVWFDRLTTNGTSTLHLPNSPSTGYACAVKPGTDN